MSEKIRAYEVTCEGAPVQVQGQLYTGEYFYFRARHRTITLGCGDSFNAAAEDPRTVAMHVEGWEEDRHPLSALANPMPLIECLLHMRDGMIRYAARPIEPCCDKCLSRLGGAHGCGLCHG